MVGTAIGGRKTAKVNRKKYGKDFYKRIGALGGRHSTNGGFASDKVGKDGLTGRQRASIAGKKGGENSSRAGVKNGEATPKKKNKKVVIPWGEE